MFYSGIDLHKDMSFITTINEKGKIIAQKKLPNHNVHLLDYFDSIGHEHKAVVESTGIDRFPSINRFYSYCRLVPGASNSNRVNRHKSSKDGNKYLKMAFMEASVRACQHYKEVKSFYQSKARKKHKNIARALVAQQLAKICYHVLSKKTDFDHTFKGKALSRHKTMKWPRLTSPERCLDAMLLCRRPTR